MWETLVEKNALHSNGRMTWRLGCVLWCPEPGASPTRSEVFTNGRIRSLFGFNMVLVLIKFLELRQVALALRATVQDSTNASFYGRQDRLNFVRSVVGLCLLRTLLHLNFILKLQARARHCGCGIRSESLRLRAERRKDSTHFIHRINFCRFESVSRSCAVIKTWASLSVPCIYYVSACLIASRHRLHIRFEVDAAWHSLVKAENYHLSSRSLVSVVRHRVDSGQITLAVIFLFAWIGWPPRPSTMTFKSSKSVLIALNMGYVVSDRLTKRHIVDVSNIIFRLSVSRW